MYLVVEISSSGLLTPLGETLWKDVIHKGSRKINLKTVTYSTLKAAAPLVSASNHGILKLTPEGGGATIYRKSENTSTWQERLAIWESCYGGWMVRDLNITP